MAYGRLGILFTVADIELGCARNDMSCRRNNCILWKHTESIIWRGSYIHLHCDCDSTYKRQSNGRRGRKHHRLYTMRERERETVISLNLRQNFSLSLSLSLSLSTSLRSVLLTPQPVNSPTLRYRRHRGDMIEVYKILHNIYDIFMIFVTFCISRETQQQEDTHSN